MAIPAFAAEKEKEKTIKGEAKCAKCALKEAGVDKCQNVITTEEHGKKVTYYLAKNDISDKFHKNVCQEAKKVTATGKVKEVDGKKVLTVSKIDLAE